MHKVKRNFVIYRYTELILAVAGIILFLVYRANPDKSFWKGLGLALAFMAIIALIALQAMTPNAIAEHFDTSRQAVSKHLRILTECELVQQEQKGREIYYSLEINKMKEIDEWLEQYRKIWESRFEQLGEVLEVMKKQKSEE